MKLEIIKRQLINCSAEDLYQLRAMTLSRQESDSSYMRDTLDNIVIHRACTVALARNLEEAAIGERLNYLGWAIIRPYEYKQRLIQVFVKPEHRRLKIGTQLYQALNDGGADITVKAWNARSHSFFSALKANYFW